MRHVRGSQARGSEALVERSNKGAQRQQQPLWGAAAEGGGGADAGIGESTSHAADFELSLSRSSRAMPRKSFRAKQWYS